MHAQSPPTAPSSAISPDKTSHIVRLNAGTIPYAVVVMPKTVCTETAAHTSTMPVSHACRRAHLVTKSCMGVMTV